MPDDSALAVPQAKGLLDDPKRVAGLIALAAMAGFLIGYRLAATGPPPPNAPGPLPDIPCAGCREKMVKEAEARQAAFRAARAQAQAASTQADDESQPPATFDHTAPATGPVLPKDTDSAG